MSSSTRTQKAFIPTKTWRKQRYTIGIQVHIVFKLIIALWNTSSHQKNILVEFTVLI